MATVCPTVCPTTFASSSACASETTTRADGSEVTAAFKYGTDNRLLSATGERFSGPLEYDAAGRATKIGDVGLTYDAAAFDDRLLELKAAQDRQRNHRLQ